jgi:outer membrane receptor protein involved in Fe transport
LPDDKALGEMTLEELLDLEVSSATRGQAMPVRATPGVLWVMERDEILRSGARDLEDLLNLVPGFAIGVDGFNALGFGFRGLWAMDGKILVLLDGHEMHESLYMTVPFGNRLPVDQIERLEVLRGPGSAVYGGLAELAVLNIVTRQAEQQPGVYGALSYGQRFDGALRYGQALGDTYARRTVSAGAAYVIEALGDLALQGGVFIGQGQRSDADYTDIHGERINLTGASATDPLLLHAQVGWRGLRLKYLFDDFAITQRDGYGTTLPTAFSVTHATHSLILSYDGTPWPSLRVQPSLRYVFQRPWVTLDERAKALDGVYSDATVQRWVASVLCTWDVHAALEVVAGAEGAFDAVREDSAGFPIPPLSARAPDAAASNDSRPGFEHGTAGVFAQALVRASAINFLAALRYEHHSLVGGSWVPRVGVTWVSGDWHAKLLFNQAFRVPANAQLGYSPEVTSRKTTVYELELGYRIAPRIEVVLNGFDITLDKPIVYFYDDATGAEGYRNFPGTGSRGLELELRYDVGSLKARLAYSFYDTTDKNRVDTYAVPGHKHVLLGFSPHKLSGSVTWQVTEAWSLHADALFLGTDRFGYASLDDSGAPVLHEAKPELVLNAYVRWQPQFFRGAFVGLGGYNLLNTPREYLQPYNNLHAPYPGPSLEVMLRLGYETPR